MDGMHMVQREQDGMNKAFLMALMREQQESESNGIVIDPVSYTHLTLPTILRV